MNEIKQAFSKLEIPSPSSNFEDRIIAASIKPAKVFNLRAYAVAAVFVFVVGAAALFPINKTSSQNYAALIDGSAIIDESDIYDDLI